MRRALLAAALLLACGGPVFQVGDPGSCNPGDPLPACCQGGCDGSQLVAPVCQNSTWVCPQDAKASISCPETTHFCSGPDSGS